MRQNAMDFQAMDKDNDHKLDFEEFCALVRDREEGDFTDEELQARFVALGKRLGREGFLAAVLRRRRALQPQRPAPPNTHRHKGPLWPQRRAPPHARAQGPTRCAAPGSAGPGLAPASQHCAVPRRLRCPLFRYPPFSAWSARLDP